MALVTNDNVECANVGSVDRLNRGENNLIMTIFAFEGCRKNTYVSRGRDDFKFLIVLLNQLFTVRNN